jgi:hypothetical protein
VKLGVLCPASYTHISHFSLLFSFSPSLSLTP